MAEILGAFASGVTIAGLAIGVVRDTQKLRRLWRDLQGAPRDIEETLEELEILGQSLILLQYGLGHNAQDPGSAAVIERCLELCQKAAESLEDIVSRSHIEPGTHFRNRQRAKLQAFSQKGEIKNVRERLHRAVKYLGLAVNCYSMSMQSEQLSLMKQLASRLSNSQPINSSSTKSHSINISTMVPTIRKGNIVRKSQKSLGIAMYARDYKGLPSLWDEQSQTDIRTENKVYEEWRIIPAAWSRLNGFCIRWTPFSIWQYSFKTIRVVDDDSQIFEVCATGNIEKMISLLSAKSATLSDVNDDGESLLHVAGMHNQPQMCQWLLRQGADIDLWTHAGFTPLHYASLAYYNSHQCRDTIKVLLEDGLADVTIDMGGKPLSTVIDLFHGPVEAFRYITSAVQDSYGEIVDYTLAWQCGRCYGALPTAYAKAALQRSPISPKRLLHIDEATGTKRTLLHAVASNLADSAVVPFDAGDAIHILNLLLDAKANLHPRDKYGATPFDYLCYGTHSFRDIYQEEKLRSAVLQWLQALHSNGIDLRAYAKEEERLHPCGKLIHCRQIRPGLSRRCFFLYEGFKTGLSICVKDERTEIPNEQKIPGSWLEYADADDREIIWNMDPFGGWDLQFEL